MSITKKKYLFTAEHYKEWTSVLEGKSLAINIYAFKEHETVKAKTGATGKLAKIKMGITISESLLPKHCNPELVERALASLEKNPDNPNLLNILAEYTKNNRFERVGYYGLGAVIGCIAVAAVIASIAITLILISYNAAIFAMALSVAPLELFFTFNLFSICIYSIVSSSIFLAAWVTDALSTHFLNSLGLKIGRGGWISC